MNQKYSLNLQPGKTYRMKNATDGEWISKRFDGASLQGDDYPCFITLGRGKAPRSSTRKPSWELIDGVNQAYKTLS